MRPLPPLPDHDTDSFWGGVTGILIGAFGGSLAPELFGTHPAEIAFSSVVCVFVISLFWATHDRFPFQ